MIENVKNPVIFGIVSMIIGIIAFIINLKLRNEEVDRSELIKICILGFMVGVLNSILFIILTENGATKIIADSVNVQEFNTGTPNF